MDHTKHPARHLAILVQPFLDLILKQQKTIETRFSKVKCAPFQKVKTGDVILLKQSSGMVVGEMVAGRVEYFSNITPKQLEELKKFSRQICADYDPKFWEKRKEARYITFIHIASVKTYEKPYPYPKKDRRAWIVFS